MDALKEFRNDKEKEMMQLLLLKWACDKNEWIEKYMHVLTRIFGKEFTTLDMPLKQSRAYELVKEWEVKGLVRVTDHSSKAKKYVLTPTLFAKAIEEQTLTQETKQALLDKLDELIKPQK